MKDEVDQVLRTGDSIGGIFEVVVHGAPAGLGTMPIGTSGSTASLPAR